jgi:hypothetical protein
MTRVLEDAFQITPQTSMSTVIPSEARNLALRATVVDRLAERDSSLRSE